MSNFFRDSNLFATRNNKPLFQSGNGIKIGGNSSGLSTSVVLNPFNHYKKADKYNPFNEGGKLQGHGNGEDESKIALEAHVDEKYEDEQKKENIDERKNEIRDYDRNKGEKENISLDTSTNTIYDGDDEIEITEVRDLSDNNDVEQNQNLELDNKAKENMKEFETDAETTLSEQNQGSNNNNNSNKMDKVSMEYLLNTISHLNEKNSFLQNQILVWKSKNESINNQLNKQADSVITLKQQIHKLKTYLSSFNADLIDLKNKIINFGKKRDNLAVDLSNAKINISQEHQALTSLKSLVTNLKNQQHLNQSTMEQKQLQMDNLKIKVNDLAGRLSEEKIKNNQLNKSLLNSSNKYESDLFRMSEKNQKLIELLLTKRIDFEKDWEVFVRNLNEQLIKFELNNGDSFKTLKLSLDDNFNEIALRFKTLNAFNDSIKVNVSDLNSHLSLVKNDLVSTLSTIDQNISSNINKASNLTLQNLEHMNPSSAIETFSTKIMEAVNQTLMTEKLVSSLQLQNKKLEISNVEKEKESSILKIDLSSKKKEIQNLTDKISNLTVENSSLIDTNLLITNNLEREKKELVQELETHKLKYSISVKEYQEKIAFANCSNKKIEEQNIKLFNEERKKVDGLTNELKILKNKLSDANEKNGCIRSDLLKAEEFEKHTLAQLNKMKSSYNDEANKNKNMKLQLSDSEEKLTGVNNHLKELQDKITKKEDLIVDLQNKILEKENELSTLKTKLDIMAKKPQPAESLDDTKNKHFDIGNIFAESRTSTTIKEDVKQNLNKKIVSAGSKISKSAKPANHGKTSKNPKNGNLLTKEVKQTNQFNSKIKKPAKKLIAKRKLIGSSQDSSRSLRELDKQQPHLTKDVLQDLDIFNEFEAIERLGSIEKPRW